MSKLSFRARALDASKPMPIYLAEELPDLPDYSAINRAVPQMPSGMEKEEESEHHLQRAISGTGLIIPTPEVCAVNDLEFYERCYPPDYKMPKQHIHMQPLWEEQEAPEYDIDSEDERWLKQQRHPELTEWKFEQMMDKLEKSSGQTVVTLHEAKLLLERHDDLVTAVYDYWLNKRLTTQHALILSVKTESRPGQSSNNPYLAFRRRTEKMQTRKNRKNDESSYEKMLKLRRDLARALTLLELVARRETAKRELVKLTAQLADKRYAAGDFAHQLASDPPPRPQYAAVSISASSFRAYSVPHYPPRAPPTPVDTPRQREKRPYKRRKFRHPAAAPAPLREAGAGAGAGAGAAVASSSDEEAADDGPFAFRRKPGCYYEMPTTTLCGDPVDPDRTASGALFEHELDERHRFTLTSINHPYPHCVGFARRRVCRGGRVALDRVRTPLQDLWPTLPFTREAERRLQRREEVELETKAHRTPKEITRDYHTGGKYPWRHAFRQHLARNPHLWTEPDIKPIKMDIDIKTEPEEPKYINEDLKATDIKFNDEYKSATDIKYISDDVKFANDEVNSGSVSDSERTRTIDCNVRESLRRAIRKRSWSGCSDSSYESDESLQPVEKEFENFINEVNKKWLHFRPKTPPPSPPPPDHSPEDQMPVALDTPLAVELRTELPTHGLDTFTTTEFTLADLYGDINPEEKDNSGSSLDISGEDLLNENFTGLTEAQVESILSETDLKALADVDLTKEDAKEDILDVDSFLLQGQGMETRACPGWRRGRGRAAPRGCSTVRVSAHRDHPILVDILPLDPPAKIEEPPPAVTTVKVEKTEKMEPVTKQAVKQTSSPARQTKTTATAAPKPRQTAPIQSQAQAQSHAVNNHKVETHPVPTSKIIVEEVNEVPQIKVEKPSPREKRKDIPDTIEEVSLPHGVQLKTVQTKHSPLKKHIITSSAHRRASDVTVTSQDAPAPQIVTVAVSDSLKVRLQNHLLSSQSGVLMQNGPFSPVAVALPIHHTRETGATVCAGGSPRRVSAPLVQLAGVTSVAGVTGVGHKPLQLQAPLVVAPHHHQTTNKLKVLHAHPLTHAQRAQLLGRAAAAGGGGADKPPLKHHQLTQLIEIKAAQLGKGPHLVNVVRQPAPGAATVARLELNDNKRRAVVALEGGARATGPLAARPHRVSLSLDARHLVRAALPATRPQIQLKNRTLQVATPVPRSSSDPSPSVAAISAPNKTLPTSVVANLLHKNLPKSTPKLSIAGGAPLAANVQAIAFTTAQLKARQARLVPPRPPPNNDMVEAGSVSGASSSEPLDGDEESVRRRDSLPMEVT